jgi:hypothetical protein
VRVHMCLEDRVGHHINFKDVRERSEPESVQGFTRYSGISQTESVTTST